VIQTAIGRKSSRWKQLDRERQAMSPRTICKSTSSVRSPLAILSRGTRYWSPTRFNFFYHFYLSPLIAKMSNWNGKTRSNRGRPYRGRGRGGRSWQQIDQAPSSPAPALGSLRQELRPDDLVNEAMAHTKNAVISDCNAIASYNWLGKGRHTVLVPGAAAENHGLLWLANSKNR
jgi:hypothetical protein